MLSRRWFFVAPFALLVMLFGRPSAADRRRPTLREQLTAGLRATRPNELAFIGRVVDLVDQGALPLRTVNAAFDWARKRNPPYPFPFFERAIKVLAARQGVSL